MEYDKNLQQEENMEKGVNFILSHLMHTTPTCEERDDCAEKKADKLTNSAVQSAIDACLLKAKERIVSMPQYDYEELLANLVVAYVQPGYDEIVFNLRDKNRLSLIRFIVLLNNKIKQSGSVLPLLKIANETIDAAGGFLLKCGKQHIDCTIETLLERKKKFLAPALAEILFE